MTDVPWHQKQDDDPAKDRQLLKVAILMLVLCGLLLGAFIGVIAFRVGYDLGQASVARSIADPSPIAQRPSPSALRP